MSRLPSIVVATLALSLTAPVAFGDTSVAPVDTSVAPATRTVRAPRHKSQVTATALTIGGYLAGTGLMFAAAQTDFEPALLVAGTVGMIALPSAGEWYAGESGFGGMELRALAVLGTELAIYNEWEDDGTDRDALKWVVSHSVRTVGIFFVGELVYSVGTVFSAVRANSAVRRFNEAHALSIAPMALRTPAGQHAAGLGLSLRW